MGIRHLCLGLVYHGATKNASINYKTFILFFTKAILSIQYIIYSAN